MNQQVNSNQFYVKKMKTKYLHQWQNQLYLIWVKIKYRLRINFIYL